MLKHGYSKKIVISIVSIALTLVAANILSYFYIRYSLNSKADFNNWNESSIPALWGAMTWDRGLQYHPYWGYFEMAEEPMPIVANADFTVRIIGGSFASDIGRYAVRNPEAIKALVAEIKPGVDPQRINIINSAHAGFHQPQQLHLVLDHVDDTDLFISYEGYNEMMHEWTKCAPRNWPLLAQFRYDPSLKAHIPNAYFVYKKAFQLMMDWKDWSLVKILFYKMGPSLNKATNTQIQYALLKAEKSCKEQSTYPTEAELVSDWVRALKIQASVVKSQKKRIFVFVQPNQYIAGSKLEYSEQERDLFKPWSPELKDLTNRRFQFALQEIESQGYIDGTVVDLTKIFAKESQTIYVDGCCHIKPAAQKMVYEESLGIIRSKLVSRRIKHD